MLRLSRIVEPSLPLYEGDPEVRIERLSAAGCSVSRLELGSHSFTHIDPPRHLFSEGRTLDEYPPSFFCGTASVTTLPLTRIEEGVDMLFISTGWERLWGSPSYMTGYPVLTGRECGYIRESGVRIVGFDTPSPDKGCGLENHRRLLSAGVLIIENMVNLEPLKGSRLNVSVSPLLFRGADGALVTIFATTVV